MVLVSAALTQNHSIFDPWKRDCQNEELPLNLSIFLSLHDFNSIILLLKHFSSQLHTANNSHMWKKFFLIYWERIIAKVSYQLSTHCHYIHFPTKVSFIYWEQFWSNFKVVPSIIIGSKVNFKATYVSSIGRMLHFGLSRD